MTNQNVHDQVPNKRIHIGVQSRTLPKRLVDSSLLHRGERRGDILLGAVQANHSSTVRVMVEELVAVMDAQDLLEVSFGVVLVSGVAVGSL